MIKSLPPDMGQISNDPRTLVKYIFGGGWIVKKPNRCEGFDYFIFDGTSTGREVFIESDLIVSLLTYDFITKDSGNFDFKESYYKYDIDYDKMNNNLLLFALNAIVKNNNYKDKYKLLIRQHKLERIIK